MQGKFNFRSVEGALTRLIFKRNAVLGQRGGQVFFRTGPHVVGADAFFRTRGQLDGNLVEAESAVHVIHHADTFVHFGAHLLFGTEDVGVILREAAHAHQAVQ